MVGVGVEVKEGPKAAKVTWLVADVDYRIYVYFFLFSYEYTCI